MHIFRAHLEHLLIVGTTILDDKIVLTLMRNMPPSYQTFISSLKRQPILTLQSLKI
jgi:hypothetical protein